MHKLSPLGGRTRVRIPSRANHCGCYGPDAPTKGDNYQPAYTPLTACHYFKDFSAFPFDHYGVVQTWHPSRTQSVFDKPHSLMRRWTVM